MRNKSTLVLLEQSVMLLIFALAAALCLRAFFQADRISGETAALDRAVTAAQTAAETLKHARGDLARAAEHGGTVEENRWVIPYDEQWQTTTGEESYLLTAELCDSGKPGLGTAHIVVTDSSGTELFQIPVAWQEVRA